MAPGTCTLIEVEPGIRLAVQLPADLADSTKPAILFSHSLAADSGMWREMLPLLAPHARLILTDTRGHGGSDVPAAPYSLERLGRDAIAILDALKIDRAVICGLSLGGLIGQWLGIHCPHRVSGLVLANTAASFTPPSLWKDRAKQVQLTGMEPLVAPTLERWLTASFRSSHPARAAEIAATIAATDARGYAGSCAVLAATDLAPELGAIACPALVLAGRYDPSTTLAQAEALVSAIKTARLTELDAAHLSAVEAPAAFAQAIYSFLPATPN